MARRRFTRKRKRNFRRGGFKVRRPRLRRKMIRSGGYYAQTGKNGISYELKTSQEYYNGDTNHTTRKFNTVPTTANSGLLLLNGLATGTDYNNRIGRKILIKSLLIRGVAKFNSTDVATPNQTRIGRIIIFIDKQPNGSDPAITSLLDYAGVSSNYSYLGVMAPLNLNNRDRFVVLRDKFLKFNMGSLQAATGTTTGTISNDMYVNWKVYIKKLSIDVTYSNTNTVASIADISTNSMFIAFLSQDTAGSEKLSTEMYYRIRYYDS